jgi:O-antigen ligase
MGVVAVIQFRLRIDLSDQLRQIPGFTITNENIGIDARASHARVAGTALHAIELGVTAAVLLPLAITAAFYRGRERSWTRWIPVALIAACIPVSVSRSAIIAVVVSMGTLIVCMDAPRRLRAMMLAPLGVMAMFLSAPGLIGTFKNFFSLGSDDTSIAKRQRQVPLVEQLVSERPLFGRGGGTWLPPTPETILDNQYYRQTIENGLVGSALITLGYFVLPPAIAIVARHRARDPELRLLGGALAGAAAVSLPIAMTFDSLAFPMYAGTQALVVGLIGAYWLVVRTESSGLDDPPTRTSTRESSSAPPSST